MAATMQNSTDSDKPKAAADERARLRRNQRNSRARKQSYVQDLERRWSDCVRLGVQASVEIQKEARRIHQENDALRCVIRELGMSDDALKLRLDMRRRIHDPPVRDMQSGAPAAAASTSSTVTPPAASSHSNAVPLSALGHESMWSLSVPLVESQSQSAIQALPITNVADPSSQFSVSTVPDSNLTDALQTWDLYSWVNDLSSIKDAYSINAQSYLGYNHPSSHSNPLYQGSGDPGVEFGATRLHLNGIDMESIPWCIDDSQPPGSNGFMFLQNDANTNAPDSNSVDEWHSREWGDMSGLEARMRSERRRHPGT